LFVFNTCFIDEERHWIHMKQSLSLIRKIEEDEWFQCPKMSDLHETKRAHFFNKKQK
jgi:bacterioferritin (cytochrome b1)